MAKDKEDPIDLLEDKRFVKKLQATFDIWLEKELKPLKEQIAQLEQQKNNAPQVTFSGIEVLNQEKKFLEEQLAKNQVKLDEANDKLAAKLKENQALKDLLNRLEVQKNEAEMLLAKLQEEFQAEKQSKIELQKALEKQLKKEDELQSRLDNCFPKGQELFADIKKLTPSGQDCLKAIYATKNLETFILSGAKENNLERLWDEIANCFVENREKDAEILWSCFTYFLELVNKNSEEPMYELCKVSVGDAYDRDYHYNDRNGSMQGKVSQIRLLGYKNCSTGALIKRSIVTLTR